MSTAIKLDGHKLRTLRQNHGYTQDDLARKAGVSRWTVLRLEKESHGTTPKVAIQLANLLGTSVVALRKETRA